MAKNGQERSKTSWGVKSEIKFIKHLGRHQERYANDHSEKRWLQMYIKAHLPSPHPHHQAGIEFARDRLQQLEG